MFMKLQMSLIASQLEQQRLMCGGGGGGGGLMPVAMPVQQTSCGASYGPGSWAPMRGITPPFYPPPGPLPLANWNALPQPACSSDMIAAAAAAAGGGSSQHSNNFNDPDYVLYSSYHADLLPPPPLSRDGANTSNPNTVRARLSPHNQHR